MTAVDEIKPDETLWASRIRSRSAENENGCWIWQRSTDRDGYGRIHMPAAGFSAHRASYLIFVWQIPENYDVDHLCRVRACVNPAHLEAVTRAENNRRRAAAKTHCKNGHEYNERNTYLHSKGEGLITRICRICNAEATKRKEMRRR